MRFEGGLNRSTPSSAGQGYNPDFIVIVIVIDGTHGVVEVKMDKELASEDVKGKREAAKRWRTKSHPMTGSWSRDGIPWCRSPRST